VGHTCTQERAGEEGGGGMHLLGLLLEGVVLVLQPLVLQEVT